MAQPEKMELTSMDVAAQKREELKRALGQAFPEVFAEGSIDFDQLKRVLGEWVEPAKERFGLNWPGKAECMKVIQKPSVATLTPSIADSLNFETARNIFIEGDNLEVLKLLQKSYFGRIKAIYIDPPYNTGKEFIYPDRYSESLDTYLSYTKQIDGDNRKFSTNTDATGRYHSNWLNMMFPRLYLARNLLTEDGLILISIDENEFHNLKKLADEVFGESNYAGEVVWKNSSRNDQDYISVEHEYILVYVKNKDVNKGVWLEKKEGLDEIYKAFDQFRVEHGNNWSAVHNAATKWFKQFPESNPIFASKHYSWMDDRGVYFPDNVSGPNAGQYVYDVLHPVNKKKVKPPSRGWFCPEEKMKELIKGDYIHFGPDETTVPCLKTYLKKTEFKSISSVKFKDGRAASKRLERLFGAKIFTNPKDEQLLRELLKALGVKNDDTILDFFAGSGTLYQAVVELNADQQSNCRAILVQLPEDLNQMVASATGSAKAVAKNAVDYLSGLGLPENICEIAKQRMRLVAATKRGQHSGQLKFGEERVDDTPFRVFKLTKSNFKIWNGDVTKFDEAGEQLDIHIDHINAASTADDILYELLLKAGFSLETNVETVILASKPVFSIEHGSLLICLEKEITPELIDALAEAKPLQVICLDEGFKGNDQLKANAVQTFKARAQAEESEIVFRTV